MGKSDNELIAEFMGWNKDAVGLWLVPDCFAGRHRIKLFSTDQLIFDSSWDWLMPVVEKINNTKNKYGSTDVIIYCRTCHINDPEQIIIEATGKNMFEATYKAVVEFIRWHNQNK